MPTKIKHYYRAGYRPALDPQVVGDELQRIEEKYNGEDPHHIVKEAESEKSPIHNAFEWDNTVAGHSWRLQQARLLIRAVVHDRRDPKTGKINPITSTNPLKGIGMKKLLSKLFLSGVLATSLFAHDGTYFCMMTKVQKGDTSYELTEKQMKQNTVSFTIKDHILNDGENTFVYQFTEKGIDMYKDSKSGLVIGIHQLKGEKNLYIADIAKPDDDSIVVLGCKVIK